jgi:AcrR family transcriptional regulator
VTSLRLPAAERRQAVLDTACHVFAQKSYRGATTAEIAAACGISEPILYRHFGSKRELYAACLDAAWTAFEAEAEAAIAGDPDGCLGKVTQAFMRSSARIRVTDLWIQALNEAEHDETVADMLRVQVRRAHGFFVDAIRRGQEIGAIRAERDPVAEAWIWIGGGLLSTLDQKLGGLLGGDVDRIRRERSRWMMRDGCQGL